MTFEAAMRATEVLLGVAFFLQSLEHLATPGSERHLHLVRAVLAVGLVVGFASAVFLAALFVTSLALLVRHNGPYNGGADRMGMLILICLCAAHAAGSSDWREIALGYLAVQLVLSYAISGWVKIVNPDWRSGRALRDVFAFSAYPVSRELRGWANWPRLLAAMGWAVMVFELLFPLAFFHTFTLIAALVVAAMFHLTNACLFGLNRFFWIWIAAYPSIMWFQGRVLGS